MSILKQKLAYKIEEWRPRTKELLKNYSDVKISDVTIAQAMGGMRGIKCLVTDISYLDPIEGIRFRGYTIPEVLQKLPKPPRSEVPYVEGFLYLLLTGDVPTKKEVKAVEHEMEKRYDKLAKAGVRHIVDYNKKVNNRLGIIGKITELSLPHHQPVGLCQGIAVIETEHAGFG